MTVQELIDKLTGFPPEMRVVTPGFDESEYDDVETVKSVRVAFRDQQSRGHCGQHGEAEYHPELPSTEAVLINF